MKILWKWKIIISQFDIKEKSDWNEIFFLNENFMDMENYDITVFSKSFKVAIPD